MNSRIILLILALFGLVSSPASGLFQPAPTVTRDNQGFARLGWLSLPGRTYFVQYSYDLETWMYTSEIFQEGFGPVGMTFDSGDDTIFLRLKYTDFPTYDAELANFDGAGKTNQLELDEGTDPMVAEAGEPLVPTPGSEGPAPAPEIAGLTEAEIEADFNTTPVHIIKIVETSGNNNGTRYYYLNWNYQLIPGLTLPSGDTGESSWPANISRKPAGVETKITFETALGESGSPILTGHERPIDLLLYESNFSPSADESSGYFEVRKVKEVGTLIIPRIETTSEPVTIVGDNDPNGNYWKISPFVVRGLEPASNGGPNEAMVYSQRSGTDIVSRRSRPARTSPSGTEVAGDLGHDPNTFIMAPRGGDSTSVEIEANPPFPIVLEGGVTTITPALISNQPGLNGAIQGLIRAQVTAQTPEDHIQISRLNIRPEDDGINDPSIPDELTTTPVMMVAIPPQTVTVNVYPIASVTDGVGADSAGNPIVVTTPPDPLLSEQEIQSYFDQVYLKQTNVKCQIVVHPVAPRRWDIAKGKVQPQGEDDLIPETYAFYFLDGQVASTHGDRILDFHGSNLERDAILAGRDYPRNELHILWVGGATEGRNLQTIQGNRIEQRGFRWVGSAPTEGRRCYVVGDLAGAGNTKDPAIMKLIAKRLLITMAHEIGHYLIGPGHPDTNTGPAPLASDPALQQKRLMASGKASVDDYELVNIEWFNVFSNTDVILNTVPDDE